MLNLKSAVLAALAMTGAFASSSAFALTGYEIWDGTAWVRNGTVDVSGPTKAVYVGNTVNCTSTFTLTLASGVATISNAVFTGSGACTSITNTKLSGGVAVSSLPWTVSTPTAAAGTSVSITISSIGIHFTAPAQYCAGSATGTLTNANSYSPNPPTATPPFNNFTFSGTLGACAVRDRTAAVDGGLAPLTSSKPIRVY